jgi:hypothetical protein
LFASIFQLHFIIVGAPRHLNSRILRTLEGRLQSGSHDVIGKIDRGTQKQTHNQGMGYLLNELYLTKKPNLDVDARHKAWVY